MKTPNIVKSFIALGHDSRLAIYNLLMSAGENGIAAGEIGKTLGVPGATLSFHLTNLVDAKLIGSRRDGRTVYYYVRYKRVKKLIQYLSDQCEKGLNIRDNSSVEEGKETIVEKED